MINIYIWYNKYLYLFLFHIYGVKHPKFWFGVIPGLVDFRLEDFYLLGGAQLPELLELREVRKAPVGMQEHLQVKVHFSLLLDGRNERICIGANRGHDLQIAFNKKL